MTTEAPPVVFAPVHCNGTLGNGKRCPGVFFRTRGLREMPGPHGASIEDKCEKCGRIAYFG